jgi:hypothetical protein
MSEELLDDPEIVPCFQKVCGKGMTQRVEGGVLGDSGCFQSFLEDTSHGVGVYWLIGLPTGK